MLIEMLQMFPAVVSSLSEMITLTISFITATN